MLNFKAFKNNFDIYSVSHNILKENVSMQKKGLAVAAAAIMAFSFTSCSKKTDVKSSDSQLSTYQSSSASEAASSEAESALSSTPASSSAIQQAVSKTVSTAIKSSKATSAGSSRKSSAASGNKVSSTPDIFNFNVAGMYKNSGIFDDFNITTYSIFDGFESIVNRPLTGGQPAYNYSVNLLKLSSGGYRCYFGARWKSDKGDGDHVLLYDSKSGTSGSWQPCQPEPLFWQGNEEKKVNKWFSNNVLEPEPMIAGDGKWIMYTQVEIDKGRVTDDGQRSTAGADRIMLMTSNDGKNWARKEDRGVVINLPQPECTQLHHEEVIYVPWDKDKKCYWMYLGISVNDEFQGICRIRSSDYTTFDYSQKEDVSGFAQIGNQIGYLKEASGGPVFVRITFTDNDAKTRTVPALQYSKDGLDWSEVTNILQGSSDNKNNKNCYFLGMATIDGRGALEYLGNNTWRALYAATTSDTPVAPEIFNSKIGGGSFLIHLKK